MSTDTVPSGPNFALEEEANRLLADDRRGVTKLSDKKDILTEEQLLLRKSKEVYNQNGVPDRSLMSGIFKREYNPTIGRRPTSGLKSSETMDYGSLVSSEW